MTFGHENLSSDASRGSDANHRRKAYSKPYLRVYAPDELSVSKKLSLCKIKYISIHDAFSNYREAFIDAAFADSEIRKYRLIYD